MSSSTEKSVQTAVASHSPRIRSALLKRIESAWTQLARRRLFSCVLVVSLTLLVRTALLRVDPIPQRIVHDEFSYVLGAETFAMGRLANPAHPLWRFFETYHVNMQPTYVSKYPPGQAAFLALGIVLAGHPWYGVLISVALMCGSLCWMLQGWLPPKYALLGGLLAVLQFGFTHYWMDSYWGGAVAATGGALVFGALPRLARRGSVLAALAGATGAAILANSRPFEGLVLVSLSFAALLIWTRGRSRIWLRPAVILVIAGALGGAACAMTYYNLKTTGNALTSPYSINQKRYSAKPIFWILPPYPAAHREYRDPSMRKFWESWSLEPYLKARRNPLSIVRRVYDAIGMTVGGGAGFVLVFFSACALPLVGSLRVKLALSVMALFLSAMTLDSFAASHYLAPGLGAGYLIAMFGFRLLSCVSFRGRRMGRPLAASGLALAGILFAFDTAGTLYDRAHHENQMARFRTQVLDRLGSETGKHLVLVRYSANHNYLEEYVYNTPDIDAQRIVWAFDFGREADQPLLNYYRDRRVWLVRPDGAHPTFGPYSGDDDRQDYR